MYSDISEAKNTAVSAISVTVPARFIGIVSSQFFFASSGMTSVISVSMNPGAIAFTRTPRPAVSLARLFV